MMGPTPSEGRERHGRGRSEAQQQGQHSHLDGPAAADPSGRGAYVMVHWAVLIVSEEPA